MPHVPHDSNCSQMPLAMWYGGRKEAADFRAGFADVLASTATALSAVLARALIHPQASHAQGSYNRARG